MTACNCGLFESTFRTHDGVELFYRLWRRSRPGALRLSCSITVRALGGWRTWAGGRCCQFDFFAWDARGHGRSPGHAATRRASASVRDVRLVDHIATQHGIGPENIGIVAPGGARCWGVGPRLCTGDPRHGPSPRRRSGRSSTHRLRSARARRKLLGMARQRAMSGPKFLTNDPARIASYDTDRCCRGRFGGCPAGLQAAADRVVTDARRSCRRSSWFRDPTGSCATGGNMHFSTGSVQRKKSGTCCTAFCTIRSVSATAGALSTACARSSCASSRCRARA